MAKGMGMAPLWYPMPRDQGQPTCLQGKSPRILGVQTKPQQPVMTHQQT